MKLLALVLLVVVAGCDVACVVVQCEECIAFPGPDVESGTYRLERIAPLRPVFATVGYVPYADAEEFAIEISEDRSTATFRYERNGVPIEEVWSIRTIR